MGKTPLPSPPARGAWIEITGDGAAVQLKPGRPPRGGRGLKLRGREYPGAAGKVAPREGGVD